MIDACNSQNPLIEGIPDDDQITQETHPKNLEPLPTALLQANAYKKVLISVTDFSTDQTPQKTHSQPPHTAPGFDFRDRGEPFKLNSCENVSQNPFPVWDSDDSG
jgi:hypothetical protein